MSAPNRPNGLSRLPLQWVLVPDSGQLRIPTDQPCGVTADGVTREGSIWNLSVVGAYLAMEPPLPVLGETLRLSFALADDAAPIACAARVVWQNPPSIIIRGLGAVAFALPPGCGLAFLALDPADRERIEARVRAVGQKTA
jgi:hypothetical protein